MWSIRSLCLHFVGSGSLNRTRSLFVQVAHFDVFRSVWVCVCVSVCVYAECLCLFSSSFTIYCFISRIVHWRNFVTRLKTSRDNETIFSFIFCVYLVSVYQTGWDASFNANCGRTRKSEKWRPKRINAPPAWPPQSRKQQRDTAIDLILLGSIFGVSLFRRALSYRPVDWGTSEKEQDGNRCFTLSHMGSVRIWCEFVRTKRNLYR